MRRIPRRNCRHTYDELTSRCNCVFYLQRSAKLVVIVFSLQGDLLVVIFVPLATMPSLIVIDFSLQSDSLVVIAIPLATVQPLYILLIVDLRASHG